MKFIPGMKTDLAKQSRKYTEGNLFICLWIILQVCKHLAKIMNLSIFHSLSLYFVINCLIKMLWQYCNYAQYSNKVPLK